MTACQSTPTAPVIQRADSTYETTGLGKTKIQAQENALASAKKTCGSRQAVIVKDEVRYNGVFNEKTGVLDIIHRETYEEALQIVNSGG